MCSLGAWEHKLEGRYSKLSLSRWISSRFGVPVRFGNTLMALGLPSILKSLFSWKIISWMLHCTYWSLIRDGRFMKAFGWKLWMGLPLNSTCLRCLKQRLTDITMLQRPSFHTWGWKKCFLECTLSNFWPVTWIEKSIMNVFLDSWWYNLQSLNVVKTLDCIWDINE